MPAVITATQHNVRKCWNYNRTAKMTWNRIESSYREGEEDDG
jgi:hypothetical protein